MSLQESLKANKVELQAEFNKFASDQRIDIELFGTIVDSFGQILGKDLSKIKKYQSASKYQLPEELSKESLNYKELIKIMVFYDEQKQISKATKQHVKIFIPWFPNEDQDIVEEDHKGPYFQSYEQVCGLEEKQKQIKNGLNYLFGEERNASQEIFDNHGQYLEEEFQVSLYDIPILSLNMMSQYNLSIYNDQMVDFFQDDNSYECLFKHFKTFLKSKEPKSIEQKKGKQNKVLKKQKIVELMINYQKYIEGLTKFIELNKFTVQTFFKKNQEQVPLAEIEKQLRNNLKQYEDQLAKSNNDFEKKFLSQIIENHEKQLEELKSAQEFEKLKREAEQMKKPSKDEEVRSTPPKQIQQQKIFDNSNQSKDDKREANLKRLYMFYCQQQPEKQSQIAYQKPTVDDITLHFDTFIMFTKHFEIMGNQRKKPVISDKNTLELKRIGVLDVYDNYQIFLQEDQMMSKKQTKNALKDHAQTKIFHNVQSKHQWWNNENFDRYYKPNRILALQEESETDHRVLESKKLAQMFKKYASGRRINFKQFKVLLVAMAQNMFFDQENPEYVHPEAFEKFLSKILQIDHLHLMKQKMKPLHSQNEEQQINILHKQKKIPLYDQSLAQSHLINNDVMADNEVVYDTPQLRNKQMDSVGNLLKQHDDQKLNLLPSMKQKYLARAQEIDNQQRQRENQLFHSVQNSIENRQSYQSFKNQNRNF